ncbi:MAG: glycoside hydrolase family 3 protein, partial [Clostridia bacterium]|nr:glycoside hydrolase family 3 protein [Clostridia bacterium]
MQIEEILNSLSIDEMIGQMLCFAFTDELRYSENYEKIEEYAKKYKPGGFFVSALLTDGQIEKATKIIEKHTKVPVIVASDIEIGPNSVFPEPMAWGACDDATLIEKAHRATAEYCRKYGLHWSFSPIVDINMNPDNPVTNVRAISDSPKQVAKIGAAAIRGMQYNGLMAAGCKHFPGDGVDDRNQHFCTTMNSLSKEEWMDTFGYVYKKLIAEGASSIMVGHISLPAYDEKLNDWIGYPPASISYNLQTKLLRETLGYDGCIISDAMSMVGVCAAVPADRVAVEFVKAGG